MNSFHKLIRFKETASGQTYKLTAYADDQLLFCSSEPDINVVFEFFTKVSGATGSELNRSKTKILKIGGDDRMGSEYLVDKIKVCGVWHHRE